MFSLIRFASLWLLLFSGTALVAANTPKTFDELLQELFSMGALEHYADPFLRDASSVHQAEYFVVLAFFGKLYLRLFFLGELPFYLALLDLDLTIGVEIVLEELDVDLRLKEVLVGVGALLEMTEPGAHFNKIFAHAFERT